MPIDRSEDRRLGEPERPPNLRHGSQPIGQVADVGLQFKLATELREAGRLDEAEPIYRKLTREHPEIAGGWRGLAFIARQRGLRTEAAVCFRRAVGLEPANPWLLNDLAAELRELGQIDEAGAISLRLTENHPEFASGWRGLAFIARQRGNRAQAAEFFRRAFALEPFYLWTAGDLATELLEMSRIEDAEALGAQLVEANPESSLAHVIHADCLRRNAPKSVIIGVLERALSLEPENLHAGLKLADEYLSVWRVEEAERLYNKILAAEPSCVAGWLGKAQLARRRGRAAEALAACAQALACEPASVWAVIEYSRALAHAGCLQDAKGVLAEALGRQPDDPNLIAAQATTARESGDFDEARAAFKRLAELRPDSEAARAELAVEEFRIGKAEPATERLKDLLAVNPACGRALELLADFSMVIDDWAASLDYRKKALDLDRSNIWTHLEIAKLYANSGRFSEADVMLAQTLAHFGPQPEIVVVRSDVLKARGEFIAARDALKAGLAVFSASFDLRMQCVQLLVACGDLAEAESLLAESAEWNAPQRGRVALMRGFVAAAYWRSAEARAHFNEALAYKSADVVVANEWAARMSLLCGDVAAAGAHNAMARWHEPSHRIRHRGGAKPSQSHIGQLIDEYRLDALALAELQQALREERPDVDLARLTLAYPDYTPAAISYLVSLRRAGLFPRRSKSGSKVLIPNSIVQYWNRDIPPDIAGYCNSWREQNPSFAYKLFDDASAAAFLEKISPIARQAFEHGRDPAMRADFFRLAWLFVNGGYYADADDRCIAPLESIVDNGCELVVYQEDYGTIANNFLGVAPNHPAIELAMIGALEALRRRDSDLIWLSTGPGLMTRSIARYLAEKPEARLPNVAIIERYDLFPSVAMHCAAAYKTTRRHWSRAAFTSANSKKR